MENVAIILAGGKGKRMNMDVPKQYIEVGGRPLICYTIDTFERSFVDGIVIVVAKGETEYFNEYILQKNNYTKIITIAEGGVERYDSVYNGLSAIRDARYVYIHDGARPCVTNDVLIRGREAVRQHKAVIAAVKVKDTIKIISEEGRVEGTPNRNVLCQVQTPQVFEFELIKNAYEQMMRADSKSNITDDAMVVEEYSDEKVYVYEGDYANIKVTTQDDIKVVENFLKKFKKGVDI